ncbi:BrnT family toxin [Pontiella agarivorans]|uniref:BrnT family toxin n=1 Tax=Pontiella agarivorans TaxID=3038953 RepID=UPI0032AE890D
MVKPKDILSSCTGFEWDAGNDVKSWDKHEVSRTECEQIFFNRPLIVKRGDGRSLKEVRYYAFGRTDYGRLLFVVFKISGSLIRIISARDMNDSEESRYRR